MDRKNQKVGTVKDVFGPVKNPYVSVKPDVGSPEKYVGKTIYLF
ncbi:MAG: Gar1/Naf1 family protein [Candidatus Bathyarchaeota archaeon]|nr:Gar1/Naf1 family protein [Candidatus Bathyarchaeota archaeon]